MSGRIVLSASLLVALSACSSVPSPTYRDFEIRPRAAASDSSLTARLRRAVAAAGWSVAAEAQPGVVSTLARPVPGGVFARTTASLELVPLNAGVAQGARHVRVTVHAEQRSPLGGRSKVYALDGRLRDTLLAPIGRALEAEGLVPLGTPRDRDEDAADD